MTEADLSGKNEQRDMQTRSFMVNGDVMGICIYLAMKMTRAGLGDFRIIALEGNDIDPDTGKPYHNNQVRMLVEGQKDFTPYDKALKEVLEVRQLSLEAFGDSYYADMAASEEIDNQVYALRFSEKD